MNSFEKLAIENLDKFCFNPSVFSNTETLEEDVKTFDWNLEQKAILEPVPIDICPDQFETLCLDDETESKLQETIEKFFQENKIVPSPWPSSSSSCSVRAVTFSPNFENHVTTPAARFYKFKMKSKTCCKDVWTQTELTFPLCLPKEILQILSQFYTFSDHQEAQIECQEIDDDSMWSISNLSLRRKLFSLSELKSEIKFNEKMKLTTVNPIQFMSVENENLDTFSVSMNKIDENCTFDVRTSNTSLKTMSSPCISPIKTLHDDSQTDIIKTDQLCENLSIQKTESTENIDKQFIIYQKSITDPSSSNYSQQWILDTGYNTASVTNETQQQPQLHHNYDSVISADWINNKIDNDIYHLEDPKLNIEFTVPHYSFQNDTFGAPLGWSTPTKKEIM